MSLVSIRHVSRIISYVSRVCLSFTRIPTGCRATACARSLTPLSLSLSLSLNFSLACSLSLSLALSHQQTYAVHNNGVRGHLGIAFSLSLSLTHFLSLSLSLSHQRGAEQVMRAHFGGGIPLSLSPSPFSLSLSLSSAYQYRAEQQHARVIWSLGPQAPVYIF